jgi:hypothetical protein
MRSQILLSSMCAAILVATSACTSSPTTPSLVPSVVAASVAGTAEQAKHWPVPDSDGQFGHEDPNYPPDPSQCPRGYNVVYNGWNFVCAAPVCCDHEMPRQGGFPDSWKP